jgi:sugar lactone lactonase YvrE
MGLAVALLTEASAQSVTPGVGPLATVATYAPPQLPEGLAVDRQGRLYVGMALTGEIRRMAPDGSEPAMLAILRPGAGFLTGLEVEPAGTLYALLASNNSPDSDAHGVWRVSPDGTRTLVAPLPAAGLPNAVVFHRSGDLLVSDSLLGTIWRVTRAGQVSAWAQHPLLQGDLTACPGTLVPAPFGANGLAFNRRGDLFVANTTKALVARIPVDADGAAGPPTVFAGPDCALFDGSDGLAMDPQDTLYVAVNTQNRLARIDPAGRVQTLATREQGLDGPASLVFGTTPATQRDLFITNFSITPFLSGGTPHPAVVRVAVAPGGPAGGAGLPRTGNAEAQAPAAAAAAAAGTPWAVWAVWAMRRMGAPALMLLLGVAAVAGTGVAVHRRLPGGPTPRRV